MSNINSLLQFKIPIILASKSPRRKKLLEIINLKFTVVAPEIEEIIDPELPVEALVIELAISKARYVAEATKSPAIIIGADTIVILDNEILTKPNTEAEAEEMLEKLSGRTHQVMTAIAIIDSGTGKTVTSYKITEVTFRSLSSSEISAYVATGSPMDKAGAYGVQDDFGAVFVSRINGCYYNVVGLPLEELYKKLKEFTDAEKI